MEKKLPFKRVGTGAGKKLGTGESQKPQDGKGSPAPAAPEEKGAEGKEAPKKGPVKPRGLGAKARAKSPIGGPKTERKKAPPARPPRGGIPFICSECYEEFVLPATYSRETVTCPECLHVGKRPAEDFLQKVNLHKTAEKRAFAKSLAFAEMLGVGALAFIWLISPYSLSFVQEESLRGNATMILGGAVVLLILALAWSVSQYEKNRWEIYF